MTMQSTDAALRDGIPVDKGVAIGEEWAEKNEALLRNYWDYFTRYPDMFLDTIAAKDCPIHLFYYQRILLRVMMRFRYVFGTFTRATSKSWIAIISQYLACIFFPRSKRFVVSQYKKASLDIAKQKLDEIWLYYPMLKNELLTCHISTDYVELTFKNGSIFHILSLSASSRGQRATGGKHFYNATLA